MRRTGPKLPIDLQTGTISSHEEDKLEDMIKQNLKMILLTNPGERIMIPSFGVGLPRFIFELDNYDDIYEELIHTIVDQVNIYLPVIKITNIVAEPQSSEQYLKVVISYNINFLQIKDTLDLLLETY